MSPSDNEARAGPGNGDGFLNGGNVRLVTFSDLLNPGVFRLASRFTFRGAVKISDGPCPRGSGWAA